MDLKKVLQKGLTSMKKSVEVKQPLLPETLGSEAKYPYGLQLRLDKDSLKSLGMSIKDFSIKKEITLAAKCKVTEVRSSESATGNDSETVELQITEMLIDEDKSK